MGDLQDVNTFSHFVALVLQIVSNEQSLCTAELLLKPGALQNRGLNQECNAMVVNQVKHAKRRCIKVEQTHKLYIDH